MKDCYLNAKEQKAFVRVYRAEGDKTKPHIKQSNPTLVGTWYTPSFNNAVRIKNSEVRSNPDMKIISVVIPQSVLEESNGLAKGDNEVNVINKEYFEMGQLCEEEIVGTPNIEEYLNQFAFIKDLKGRGLIG